MNLRGGRTAGSGGLRAVSELPPAQGGGELGGGAGNKAERKLRGTLVSSRASFSGSVR